MIKSGTYEWATENKNMFIGCKNNCKYCYARAKALRFKRIKSPEDWMQMRNNKNKTKPKHVDGRIMFPSTHDIFPDYIEETIEFLNKWFEYGNEFLITSKPRLEVIDRLTKELEGYKNQITFRFTIGSMDDNVLKFWEPEAPSFKERMESLRLAHKRGYKISVSCEPFLDNTIYRMVDIFSPYVTDTIWIGKMNEIKSRVDTSRWTKDDFKYLTIIEKQQSDEMIHTLYEYFKMNPKIKWKDTIKKVIGLPEEDIG